MSLPSRFAVMGAGAVGCFYGAMLARAGHQVTLIGRGAHVEAMRRDGLRLRTAHSDERLRVVADTDVAALDGAEVVLFAVKSGDTEAAGRLMAPHLPADALVLSLQNGIDNAERLRAVIPQAVAATVVYVAVEMAAPGHVLHHGRGELLIESLAGTAAAARLAATAQAFEQAGVPVTLSASAREALWGKLIINCAYNALSAILQQPYGRLVANAGVPQLMRDVVNECLQVAAAEGVAVAPDILATAERIAETMAEQYSSTAQDLARGKPSEIDHLNGLIVRRAQRHGIATPVNHALHTLLRAIEKQAA